MRKYSLRENIIIFRIRFLNLNKKFYFILMQALKYAQGINFV